MGIVVSGEDRKTNSLDEQQIINQIAAENDFGLVITTLDQLFVFFGTWWSFSLTGRVNVRRCFSTRYPVSAFNQNRRRPFIAIRTLRCLT